MESTGRIIVSSFLRVGSTRLVKALVALTGLELKPLKMSTRLGKELTKAQCEELAELPEGYVYKTHNFTPKDATPLVHVADDIKVITIWRNFYDVLTSLIFYECRTRPAQDIEVLPEVQSFLDEFGDLPDDVLVNMFIETRQRLVEKRLLEWMKFRHVVNSSRNFTLRYEEFLKDPSAVIVQLSEFLDVPLDDEKLEAVVEACSFRVMQRQHNRGLKDNAKFVRSGQIGDYRNWIDEENLDRIRGIFTKYVHIKQYKDIPNHARF